MSNRIENSIRFGARATEIFGRFDCIFRFNFPSRARSSSDTIESNRNSVSLISLFSSKMFEKNVTTVVRLSVRTHQTQIQQNPKDVVIQWSFHMYNSPSNEPRAICAFSQAIVCSTRRAFESCWKKCKKIKDVLCSSPELNILILSFPGWLMPSTYKPNYFSHNTSSQLFWKHDIFGRVLENGWGNPAENVVLSKQLTAGVMRKRSSYAHPARTHSETFPNHSQTTCAIYKGMFKMWQRWWKHCRRASNNCS